MFDDIQKPRKNHEKKTKWGDNDRFSKSAKKAGKRNRSNDHEDDWRHDVRDMLEAS